MKIKVKQLTNRKEEIFVDILRRCVHDRVTVQTTDIGADEDGNYYAYETAICADCGAKAMYQKEYEDVA